MNILLHICCAPCAIYPVDQLKGNGHTTAGLFYNPNIHPYSEYLKRQSETARFAKERALNVIDCDYDIEDYFQHIVYNEALRNRCPVCWWIRMAKTAKSAKASGFDAFTTTLLGSPYQDHDVLKSICEDTAQRIGVGFYYHDFRTGFRQAHEKAKAKGIYCQNYCGCIFSEKERLQKKVHSQQSAARRK